MTGIEPVTPLLAKQRPIYYVIGPSSFVLRPIPRFFTRFSAEFWTQIGPKFKRGDYLLQANFSLPIRTMTAVSVVCAEVQIFRTTRNSALPLIMRA